jgi:diguanylate cyclase (GGDEF)-like protein
MGSFRDQLNLFFSAKEMMRSILLMLSWLLLWHLSVLMEYAPHASIWFPPAGLSFAAFLVMGLRAMPVLLLCSIIATFWADYMYQSGQSWLQIANSGIFFGAAHCFTYWLGASLLRSMVKSVVADGLPKAILSFLVIGSVTALTAALLGTQALALSGMIQSTEVADIWLPWWIGDLAATIVLTPLFLGLLSWRYPQIDNWLAGLDFHRQDQPLQPYLLKQGICILMLSIIMLLAYSFPYAEVSFAVFFLIIPQMWMVYTETAFRAAMSLAIFSILTAIWVALLGLMEQALVYQFAITVIAASAYFGLAVPVLAAHNKQLRKLAINDGLTQVANRMYFFERAEQEISRARRYQQPVSLILFDIDHFKQINDDYGHSTGDAALVEVAEKIQGDLRQSDLFGRFGGDEFMLLLPNDNLQQATETAERLRQRLHSISLTHIPRRLSGSFGVIEVNQQESLQQAFERVDVNLLQAKRQGRNQVVSSPL